MTRRSRHHAKSVFAPGTVRQSKAVRFFLLVRTCHTTVRFLQRLRRLFCLRLGGLLVRRHHEHQLLAEVDRLERFEEAPHAPERRRRVPRLAPEQRLVDDREHARDRVDVRAVRARALGRVLALAHREDVDPEERAARAAREPSSFFHKTLQNFTHFLEENSIHV